jgi:hypothetical protein
VFRAYRVDFFIDHRLACCEKEEDGEREKAYLSRQVEEVLTFIDANIMSMPIFCRRLTFVDANILSVPIFCLGLCFKDDYY